MAEFNQISEEAVSLFIEETSKILHGKNQQPKSEAMKLRRNLTQAEKQVENIMKAIKAGIITPTTKAELERAEAEQVQAKTALEASTGMEEVLTTTLPDAAKRYRKMMAELGRTLEADVGHARQCLKTLLGEVRLVPASSGGFLEAELCHNPEGLIHLALKDKGAEGGSFKARLVAGAGFEPAAFRL